MRRKSIRFKTGANKILVFREYSAEWYRHKAGIAWSNGNKKTALGYERLALSAELRDKGE